MLKRLRHLIFGPWEFQLSWSGDIRHLSFEGCELLERIYPSVRDENWQPIAAIVEEIEEGRDEAGFFVAFRSVHRQDAIDFVWDFRVRGSSQDTFSVTLDGEARSSFKRNRLGLCIHHPLSACLGRTCVVETVNGEVIVSEFPVEVAPWQPFRFVRRLRWEAWTGPTVTLEFSGDVFETEDHRNWCDRNYKTYCTPLCLPFPVAVQVGTRVRQGLEIRVDQAAADQPHAPKSTLGADPGGIPGAPAITGGAGKGRGLVRRQATSVARPALGLCWETRREPTLQELERLRSLRLDHLRIEGWSLSDPQQIREIARLLDTRIELAVLVPDQVGRLRELCGLVSRWLLFDPGAPASTARTAEAARAILGPGAVLAVGTDFHFAEINRQRPADGCWDGLCFSACPQVHCEDDESVMDNAEAVYWPVRTARGFARNRPVFVSPITLRPRNNPVATSSYQPPPPDPRQQERFCAAWTVASFSALAAAGAASGTYFATHGPRGIQDRERLFPVYEVFAALAGFPAERLILCEVAPPGDLAALILRRDAQERWIVANRRQTRREVELQDLGKALVLQPWEVAVLDAG